MLQEINLMSSIIMIVTVTVVLLILTVLKGSDQELNQTREEAS